MYHSVFLFDVLVIRYKRNNSSICHRTELCVKFIKLCIPRQITSHYTIVECDTTRHKMGISTTCIFLCMPLLCIGVLYILLYSKFKVRSCYTCVDDIDKSCLHT